MAPELRSREKQRNAANLKPIKTKNFKQPKSVLKPHKKPASSSLPCLDIIVSSQNPNSEIDDILMIKSTPSSPKSPYNLAIVMYNEKPKSKGSSKRRYSWKKGSRASNCYPNKKKIETLARHFNPIPFSPKKEPPLDFAKHQALLSRLGLWDFLHLDFDQEIRTDMITQLVALYNPSRHGFRKSYVNGRPINLSRAKVAKALHLPLKRSRNRVEKGGHQDGLMMVSDEQGLFLEEIVSSLLVLWDDGSNVDGVSKFTKCVTERRKLEEVDWAGLIWFMMERELLKGKDLVNCYYASHMQILLKHLQPELFENNKDVSSPESGKVDKQMVLFDGKESVVSVAKDAGGAKIQQDMENVVTTCHKRKTLYLEKCGKERKLFVEEVDLENTTVRCEEVEELGKKQRDVYLLDGEFGNEQQNEGGNWDQLKCELQSAKGDEKEVVELVKGGLSRSPAKDSSSVGMLKNEEGLKVEVPSEMDSSGMDHMNWPGIDDQQFCVAEEQDIGGRKSSFEVFVGREKFMIDMLMYQDTHEEGVKTEQLQDMHLQGIENEKTCFVWNQENGEEELGEKGSLEELQCISAKSILHKEHATQMELVDEWLMQKGKEAEKIEGLAKEVCKVEIGDSPDNKEKVDSSIENALEEEVNQEGHASAESTLDEEHATQAEPENEGMVVQGEREEEDMEGFMQNIQEGVYEQEMHLHDSLKTSEANSEAEEFLGADMVSKQELLNACEGGTEHQAQTKQENITLSEHEKNDKREWQFYNPNVSEDFEMHQCAPSNVEVLEAHKGKIQVEETNIPNDLLKEGFAREVSEAQSDELLDNCKLVIQNMQVDSSIENALEEGVNQEGHASAESTLDEEHATQAEPENEGTVMQGEREEEDMEGFMQNIQEGVYEQEMHLHDSLKTSEANSEPEGFLGADMVSKQVLLNACEVGTEHQAQTKQENITLSEHEKNDKREWQFYNPNVSEDFEMHQFPPPNVEVLEEGKIQVEETNIPNDLPKEGFAREVSEAQSDELLDNGKLVIQNMQVDLRAEERNICNENTLEEGENQVGMHSFENIGENVGVETSVGNEILGANEDNMQVTLNKQNHPTVECTSVQNIYSSHGIQFTCKGEMPFRATYHDFNRSVRELPVPNLDVHIGEPIPSVQGEEQRRKNVHSSRICPEYFAPQPDIFPNMIGSFFQNSLRTEIGSLNYGQSEQVIESQMRTERNGAGNVESLDLEVYTKQIEVSLSGLTNAAKKRAEEDGEINRMLLRKLEEQSKIIEELQKLRNEEQKKNQKDVRRYEHELRLMNDVLFDYRKVQRQLNKSFTEYRDRCQLPEQPLYMDGPNGGGEVIPVREVNKTSQDGIRGLLKNFMHDKVITHEQHMCGLDHLCLKLKDLESSVSSLKQRF